MRGREGRRVGRGGMGGSIDVDGSTSRPHGRPSNSRKESSE